MHDQVVVASQFSHVDRFQAQQSTWGKLFGGNERFLSLRDRIWTRQQGLHDRAFTYRYTNLRPFHFVLARFGLHTRMHGLSNTMAELPAPHTRDSTAKHSAAKCFTTSGHRRTWPAIAGRAASFCGKAILQHIRLRLRLFVGFEISRADQFRYVGTGILKPYWEQGCHRCSARSVRLTFQVTFAYTSHGQKVGKTVLQPVSRQLKSRKKRWYIGPLTTALSDIAWSAKWFPNSPSSALLVWILYQDIRLPGADSARPQQMLRLSYTCKTPTEEEAEDHGYTSFTMEWLHIYNHLLVADTLCPSFSKTFQSFSRLYSSSIRSSRWSTLSPSSLPYSFKHVLLYRKPQR